jgi:hypothetical protein
MSLFNLIGCINLVINNAIEHGADAGGSYEQNIEGLHRACIQLLHQLRYIDKNICIEYCDCYNNKTINMGVCGQTTNTYYAGWYFIIKED